MSLEHQDIGKGKGKNRSISNNNTLCKHISFFRYEVLAKLEQLGAFQFFFTLSCADKRWDETFISLLKQRGVKIICKNSGPIDKDTKYSYRAPEIFVQEPGKSEVPLKEYIQNEEHELVRENVLTVTMNFDRRVHAFLKRIIMDESSPMKAQYYHYRVEFQMRGAGHVHGVIWVDLPELEKKFPGLQTIMTKLRTSERLNKAERDITAKFVDAFVTCSLEIKEVSKLVEEVQKHSHSHSCRKYGTQCRFGFPKFPSERTIISQPLDKEDFQSETAFKKEKKRLKDILGSVKEVLVQLEKDEDVPIDDILKRANVLKGDYYEALAVSETGTGIILKRQVKEVNINNYNPEWIKAWDGNMDLAVCLDFFAIITYITDYYTKSESAMMNVLKEGAKACRERDKKDQMKYLMQAFLTHRQTGEMEAHYRIFPHLHLSESNLKCTFVKTGFPWNRYRFLVQTKRQNEKLVEAESDDEEIEEYEAQDRTMHSGAIEIPGREGTFRAATPIDEKYSARPSCLEKMCLAEFAMNYDSFSPTPAEKSKFKDGVSGFDNEKTITSWNVNDRTPLPSQIKLSNNMGYMRLRRIRSVLRMHKFIEEDDPHEFYFSKLFLYRHWRSEDELHPHDIDACIALYNETE